MELKTDIKIVDKIIHVADLHIRLLKRHEEYEKVFENLYNSIRENKTENTIICLLGDIVHSKTDMTPELVSITSNLLKNLSSLCPLIIVPGNHDANLKNPNRLDAITPIVENIDNHRIYYLKNSGVFQFANLTFVHMSVFDDIENYIKAKDVEGNFKIALFHGTVDSSVNDYGFKLRNEDINKSFFDGYNLVLLGDIHKLQYFDKKMAYPGSLIQQNHGESLENHGYILWDLKNNSSKSVEVKNDYGFYTIQVNKGIVPDIESIPKKCKLRVYFNDTNIEDEQKILQEIKEQHAPIEITKNRVIQTKENIVRTEKNNIEILNLQDVNYQNELIEKYLNKNYNLDKEVVSEIKRINTETNSEISVEEIIRNVRWKPISFEWSNMFSYGEGNKIDFTKLSGIVGLLGENAIGKTSFIDSLSFCLFDKTSRDSSPIGILNNRSKKFDCQLEFELSDNIYTIKRDCKKKKDNMSIDYKADFKRKDVDGNIQSQNGENRWGTNKNINNKIGSFDDFSLTSFSMQTRNANFIDIGHSKRKDLIIQFIGINIFDKLLEIASEKNKEISNYIKIMQKTDYDINIKEFEEKLSEKTKLYNEKNDKDDEYRKQLQEKEDKIKEISEQITKIDLNIDLNQLINDNKKLYLEKEELETSIKNLTEKINNNHIDMSSKNSDIMFYHNIDIEKSYDELNQIKKEKNNFKNEFDKLEIIVQNKRDKLSKLGELEYDPNCSYCMNNIFVKDAIETKNEIQKYENELDNLKTKIISLEEIIKSKSNIENDYKTFQKLKNDIDEINDNIKESVASINSKQSKKEFVSNQIKINLSDIRKYKDSKIVIENNNKIKSEIEELENEIDDIKNNIQNNSSEKLKLNGEIEVIKFNLQKNNDERDKLLYALKQYDYYKYYLECIKRDGIPYEIISEVIPIIEQEINNTLSQMVDFTISINCDDKDINMYLVYNEDKIWPLELASGMEKFISSIAIRTALTEISNLPRPNFLVIDEGFGVLDSDNLNSLSLLFDYLKTKFDFTLIISHVDQIRDYVDKIININKDSNGRSNINFI